MRMNRFLYAVVFGIVAVGAALAVELTGSTYVNVTSDTAAQAKSKAFNSAQRDVIVRVLRQYANSEQLEEAVKNSSNEELLNIISSSSLDSEKISDTTYSANVSFVIDGDAARKWLEKNSVKHWLPESDSVAMVVPENMVVVNATLLQPISDWADLNAVARGVNVDLATKKIVGNNVTFVVPDKDSAKFNSALRTNGWRVQQSDGGLKIWK